MSSSLTLSFSIPGGVEVGEIQQINDPCVSVDHWPTHNGDVCAPRN